MDRYWKARLRRHLVLAALAGGFAWVVAAELTTGDVVRRVSLATAWAAGTYLVGTLLLGPLRVLRSLPNPVSFDLRRDLGIWAAILAAVHSGFGLFVHLKGRPQLYFLWESTASHALPVRYDLFGVANWTGVLATGAVGLLGLLSNDAAVRKLGPRRWKAWQRINYGVFVAVVLHAVLYQVWLEERDPRATVLWLLLALAVLVVQVAGLRKRRLASRRSP